MTNTVDSIIYVTVILRETGTVNWSFSTDNEGSAKGTGQNLIKQNSGNVTYQLDQATQQNYSFCMAPDIIKNQNGQLSAPSHTTATASATFNPSSTPNSVSSLRLYVQDANGVVHTSPDPEVTNENGKGVP